FSAGDLGLAAARSVEAHRAAVADMHEGPFDFNHVWAHRDGTIGWQLFGRLPRRRRDGLFVRDAHDPDAQWEGFVPFEQMPQRTNPPEGFLASANSATDPAQWRPVATAVHYEPRLRQDRIEACLAASTSHRAEDSMALQADVEATYALPVRDALLELLAAQRERPVREAQALALLAGWDGAFTVDSGAAAVFFFTLKALGERAWTALLGPTVGRRFAHGRRGRPRLERLLREPGDPLRPALEAAAGRPLAALADEALRAALDRVERHCGADPAGW